MKSQLQNFISSDIQTYDILIWHYVVFALSAGVIAWVIIHMIYRTIKRTVSFKFYINMLCWVLIFIFPAATYYVEITQMKISPPRVKYIIMDFSHSNMEKNSSAMDIYTGFVKDKYATCSNLKCTVPAIEFIHNRNQTAAQYSQESTGMFYCADCPSPIFFDWSKKEFYAHVFVFPSERIINSSFVEFFIR